MREIYPPPFGHPPSPRGRSFRLFPLSFVSSILKTSLLWMRFFIFLVLNSTYGQSFAFCLFSCFFLSLAFHFSSFYVFFMPTFNRIIEALIFLLYNNFSIERGCLLWNQPREPVLMASQQITTEIHGMPSLPIRFAIHIFS